MSSHRDRPYMLVKFYHKPAPGEVTSKKNWGKTGKWETQEEVFFVDRLNDKHVMENSVIIDLLGATIVKSRLEESKAEVYAHYVKKYQSHVIKAIQTWRAKRARTLKNTPPLSVIENQLEVSKTPIQISADGEVQLNTLEKDSQPNQEN